MPTLNCYATNHVHSRTVCQAFSEGHGGHIVPPKTLLPGKAMVYGILRGCGEIVKECEWVGRDYFYVDHGYFKRGYYDGYFRVVKNALQSNALWESPPDRWERLDIDLKPWREGTNIVICPISQYLGDFLGINPGKWTASVVRELSFHTDRPILVKPKDGEPLSRALEDAHCLVTHSSNAAVDAVVSGVPVVTLGKSSAEQVSWSFENIEQPEWPEREQWCFNLAYQQFTLEELKHGIALERLS